MKIARRVIGTPEAQAVALLTALAFVLRFSTLGVQNYWPDEAVTAGLVEMNLGQMLEASADIESTPPFYYVVGWVWAYVFGSDEFGLRALSALAGTAVVPLTYLAATQFVSKRAAIVATALVAVSPPLIWYSQEARAYALVVLLSVLSLYFVGRVLRSRERKALAWWAAVSGLALLTHYFAAFVIIPEAIVLLASRGLRRDSAIAVGAVAVISLALLPLALHQSAQENADWIEASPLGPRVVDIGQLFLLGQGEAVGLLGLAFALLLAMVVVALVLLVTSADPEDRKGVRVPAILAVAGVVTPLALALLGLDYVVGRNFLPALVPLIIVVATGLASAHVPRLGIAAACAFAILFLAATVAVPLDRALQRETIAGRLTGSELGDRRLAVRAAFAPATAGGEARGEATCPSGYSAASGGASWTSKELRDTPVANEPLPGHRGWAASARTPNEEDATVMILAFCVAPDR